MNGQYIRCGTNRRANGCSLPGSWWIASDCVKKSDMCLKHWIVQYQNVIKCPTPLASGPKKCGNLTLARKLLESSENWLNSYFPRLLGSLQCLSMIAACLPSRILGRPTSLNSWISPIRKLPTRGVLHAYHMGHEPGMVPIHLLPGVPHQL